MFSLKRQQGAGFEHQARLFLESKGLKFIAANQHFKCGELDLVMQDGQTIVFVEVRQRSNSAFGSAVESVDWQKQQNSAKCCKFMACQTQPKPRRCRLSF